MEELIYTYIFNLGNGKEKEFHVRLNAETLNCIQPKEIVNPEWTRLEYSQCRNCPLTVSQYEFCPIAANLVEPIAFFKDSISYEKADVLVKTKERDIFGKTTIQKGLSSLIGIYMVTSGCPIMEKLKPMVYQHLPFASPEETVYRATSMYLLGQYFLNKEGKEADWELKGLVKIYEKIRIVNEDICKRLRDAASEDASVNAVVILNVFVDMLSFSIERGLNRLKHLFSSYLSF
ncbi:MAG: hypothetical protein AAB267_06475 [Candidatus Desantisbacteria bacterium]